MTDAPAAAEPSNPGPKPDRVAADGGSTPSGRLVGLFHKLIEFGKTLINTVCGEPSAETLFDVRVRFGTRDLAMIVGRILRGLSLAAELEKRVVRATPRLDHPPARAAARVPPENQPPPAPPAEAAPPIRLPTARDIAAKARNKPIGAVIMEICGDLGIRSADPLWRDIVRAVTSHGGSFPGLMRDMFRRTVLANFFPPDTPLLPFTPQLPLAAASGSLPILDFHPP